MTLRRMTTAATCALALAAGAALAGCGGLTTEEQGVKEPAREGLAIPFEGVDYNVFITRQLNLRVPPDSAYYDGPEAPKGETLYGVFVQACNHSEEDRTTAEHFKVLDNQGNEFEPIELPEDNHFAYNSRLLGPDDCIPEAGSVAQQGPTAGSMLLFKFPVDVTENRPLELEMEGSTPDSHKTFELDL